MKELVLLHLHEIMERVYFSCSMTMCVCVCLSVTEKISSRTGALIWTRFSLNFCLLVLLGTCWNLVTFGWRSRSQWHNIHFFFMILCELPYCGSQLSYFRSKWNLICRLDMPLVDSHLNFINTEWVITSLPRYLSFLQTIANISVTIEPTNFIHCINIHH